MPGRIRKLGAALVVAALTAGLLGAGTTSAHDKKLYTVSASPTSLVGGIATPVEITLTNTTDNQEDSDLKIAAARIDAPAGLTISHVSATYRTVAGPQPWPATWAFSYNFNTRRAELTGMRVRSGSSIVVTFTVSACPAGSYQWATDVRGNNTFSGTTNKFKLVGSNPANVITPQNACRLGFVGQPTDTFPGQVITTTPYGGAPSSPVQVQAQAGDGSPLSSWAQPITLGFIGGNAAAALTGGAATAPVSGTAGFAPSLDLESNSPYGLTATSPGLVSATSAGFMVDYSAQVHCTLAAPCALPNVPAPGGGSANGEVDGLVDGTFSLEWNPDDSEPSPDCAGYDEMPNLVYFNLVSDGSLDGVTKTITINAPIPAGAMHKQYSWQHQICLRAPYAFPAFEIADLLRVVSNANFGGNTAEMVAGAGTGAPEDDRWQGLLFDCGLVGGTDPCIISRTVTTAPTPSSAGAVTIVLRMPAGDPWAR